MYKIISYHKYKNLKIHLIGMNYKITITVIKKVYNYLTKFNKKSLTKTNYCLNEGKFIG
jgi:hypothetical protein